MSEIQNMIEEVQELQEQLKAFEGHKGRPGKKGGSLPKGQGTSKPVNPPARFGSDAPSPAQEQKFKKAFSKIWANNISSGVWPINLAEHDTKDTGFSKTREEEDILDSAVVDAWQEASGVSIPVFNAHKVPPLLRMWAEDTATGKKSKAGKPAKNPPYGHKPTSQEYLAGLHPDDAANVRDWDKSQMAKDQQQESKWKSRTAADKAIFSTIGKLLDVNIGLEHLDDIWVYKPTPSGMKIGYASHDAKMLPADAPKGTTLSDVFETLISFGAKAAKKASPSKKGPGHSYSIYD